MPEGRALELTFRAELARALEPVVDLWPAAAQAWEAIGRPFPAAYARWRDAEVQILTKQVGERPVTSVRHAHAAATGLGAERLVAEVEMLALWGRVDLMVEEGAEPPPTYPGLTAREVEILHCLMAGQTNREIAEFLFISVKTVSVHVSNILRKQGVSSREEAARLGHRLGAGRNPSDRVGAERGGQPARP
jgi:DNA-binding CsgD family transcriptional regulator